MLHRSGFKIGLRAVLDFAVPAFERGRNYPPIGGEESAYREEVRPRGVGAKIAHHDRADWVGLSQTGKRARPSRPQVSPEAFGEGGRKEKKKMELVRNFRGTMFVLTFEDYVVERINDLNIRGWGMQVRGGDVALGMSIIPNAEIVGARLARAGTELEELAAQYEASPPTEWREEYDRLFALAEERLRRKGLVIETRDGVLFVVASAE